MEQQSLNLLIIAMATVVFLIQFTAFVYIEWKEESYRVKREYGGEVYINKSEKRNGHLFLKYSTHFLIGFGWYLYALNRYTATDFLIAAIVGIVTVFVLSGFYKAARQVIREYLLQNQENLVGHECVLYKRTLSMQHWIVQIKVNGSIREVEAVATNDGMKAGDKVVVVLYKNGTLFVSKMI